MAKCLVLGANGFIGSHLVDALTNDGHFVRCFGRYKNDNYLFNETDSTEIFRGDFLSRTDLEKSLEDIDYVFHFISTTNPLVSDANPYIDIDTNIRMSVELFSLCAQHNVKRVIFASTGGAIYGDVVSNSPITEETLPEPFSPYAISKLTIEKYLNYFRHKHGLQSTTVRISNPYGPRQNILSGQGVIPIFLNKVRLNEPVTIYGDGNMVRDYMYIDDLVSMIPPLATATSPAHNVYNLSSGKGHSVNQLVAAIERVTGKTVLREFRATPATYVDSVVLNNNRYLSEFDIKPATELDQGINKMWEHILDEHKEA